MKSLLIRPQVRLDNRVTFHKGQRLSINGFDAGILLKEKLRLAIGYYQLNDNLSSYNENLKGEEFETIMSLKYGAINTEFIYLNKRFISLGLPLDFGFGQNSITYKDIQTGDITGNVTGFVVLTDFGFSAIFKPTRWVGVRGVVGYRKFLFSPVKSINFDGFFNSLGLRIDIREIIKDVQMYRLKKKYKRGNSLSNAVDLITD